MTENTGLEKARATAAKLKAEVEAEKALVVSTAKEVLAGLKLSPAALAYANKHVSSGIEDLNTGVSVPQLRVHTTNVSSKNILEDGSEPTDGQIFYTGTRRAFDKCRVIILSIKKCRLEQKDEKTDEIYYKANYLVAGVLDDTLDPFVMYVKGMSYDNIWELEEQLQPFVTKRQGGIPMSMLKVDIYSKKELVQKGKYKGQPKNVLFLSLAMSEENSSWPIIEVDESRLEKLDIQTVTAESMLDRLIASKGMTEKEWEIFKKGNSTLSENAHEHLVEGKSVTEKPMAHDEDIVTDDDDFSGDMPY